MVDFETEFGLFRAPIDYYIYPGTLPSQERPPDGTGRHRYRLYRFQFRFTMPDGHPNAALQWFRPGDDGGDRIGIDPRRYAVWITRMDRPGQYDRPDEMTVIDSGVPPDRLVRIELLNAPLESYFKGWTHGLNNNEPLGIAIGCSANVPEKGSSGICQGHIFARSFGFDLEFEIQVERLGDVFAVAKKTLELLNQWHVHDAK